MFEFDTFRGQRKDMRMRKPGGKILLCNKHFIISLILLLLVQISSGNSIYEDYEECRDHEKFGNLSLICDPEHKLHRSTLRSLDNLLRDLQNKIPCECPNGCDRGEGLSNKYIGLLIVTTTPKIDASNATINDGNVTTDGAGEGLKNPLSDTAKRIYENSNLGDDKCDNGLLILYIKDQQKLATYRGQGRFALLDDSDMKRLYKLARIHTHSGDDGVALQYLLSSFDDKQHSDGNILRAESWAPVVGLTVALIVVLIILAILFSFLLARICCCCCGKKTERKDKYYISPTSAPYNTVEPIYIVAPAMSEHGAISHSSIHHPHLAHHHTLHHNPHSHSPSSIMNGEDYSIYTSPYGTTSTPLPPPPLPPPLFTCQSGPIITHPPRSRSITPTSMHRTRIHPQRSTSSTRASGSQIIRSPERTPQASKRDRVNRTSTLISGQSTYYTPAGYSGGSSGPFSAVTMSPESPVSEPMRHSSQMQLVRENGSSAGSENEELPPLPFLDPHRKREVQTKREYIS